MIVKPNTYIPIAAKRNDTGTPKAVTNATLEFKKIYKEIRSNIKPITPDDLTVSKRVFTFFEKSLYTASLRPPGGLYFFTKSLTEFETSKTDASAVFVTVRFTALRELNLPNDFTSSSLIFTFATSPKSNCPPDSLFLKLIFEIFSTLFIPMPLKRISPSIDLIEPPGKSLILDLNASIIKFDDIFLADISSGLISTHISFSLLPEMPTPATPDN